MTSLAIGDFPSSPHPRHQLQPSGHRVGSLARSPHPELSRGCPESSHGHKLGCAWKGRTSHKIARVLGAQCQQSGTKTKGTCPPGSVKYTTTGKAVSMGLSGPRCFSHHHVGWEPELERQKG